MSSLSAFAGVMVRDAHGRLLCQLRDDKPGIVAPGVWTCSPGGAVEAGETPDRAALREMREEFDIRVTALRLLLTHVETSGDAPGVYHIFEAELATALSDVKCNEGVRAEFFAPQHALDLPQHPISRFALIAYLRHLTNIQR